jgi:hypothetical protein
MVPISATRYTQARPDGAIRIPGSCLLSLLVLLLLPRTLLITVRGIAVEVLSFLTQAIRAWEPVFHAKIRLLCHHFNKHSRLAVF